MAQSQGGNHEASTMAPAASVLMVNPDSPHSRTASTVEPKREDQRSRGIAGRLLLLLSPVDRSLGMQQVEQELEICVIEVLLNSIGSTGRWPGDVWVPGR